MPYLVDGNNLAHALGLAHQGLPDRRGCAATVAAFCSSQGAKATIVFDGPDRPGPERAAQTPRVRLLFSGPQAADETILRLVSDSKSPRDLIVVTSDKSLGDKARHRGAIVERAHEFARRLDRSDSRRGRADTPKASPRETPAEVERWLAVFDPRRR